MEMLVETFEQTEILPNGETEGNEEAIRIIDELGLSGQKALMSPERKERVPYREMSAEEKRVYGELFPSRTPVENYNQSFIPLRVLQIASHAKSLGVYAGIEVWSEETKPLDPLLAGILVLPGKYGEEIHEHILARWGEALVSFGELRKTAVEKKAREFRGKAQARITELKIIFDAPEIAAENFMGGGLVNV